MGNLEIANTTYTTVEQSSSLDILHNKLCIYQNREIDEIER